MGVVSTEERSVLASVVSHDTDHLIEVGAHFDAAGQTDEARVTLVPAGQTTLFSLRLLI